MESKEVKTFFQIISASLSLSIYMSLWIQETLAL